MAHQLDRGNLDDLLREVRLEFEEMPGLALTADQARRLWALEAGLCSRMLGQLVAAGYLDQDDSGHYVRPTAA